MGAVGDRGRGELELVVSRHLSVVADASYGDRISDLASGFEPLLPATGAGRSPSAVRRLLLCSGKIYYDLTGADEWEPASAVDLARVEMLYPFPGEELAGLIGRYPALEEIV